MWIDTNKFHDIFGHCGPDWTENSYDLKLCDDFEVLKNVLSQKSVRKMLI
jgi:hypothetical protein